MEKMTLVERREMLANNALEITTAQKILYNTVVENVKFCSNNKFGKKIGYCAVPLSLCYVEMSYQKLREHNDIRNLEENWDEDFLTPITLVPHPEEYRFAIVDGQGRTLVALAKGYESLNANILFSAPTDYDERLKYEARIFIGQDAQVDKVRSLEKHPARLIIGDMSALILESLFKKYDVKYVEKKGAREPSVLGSYPTTYDIAARHGKHCLEFIFSVITNAGWNKEANGYATFVTEALKDIWTTYPADRKRIHDYLSERLRQVDPTLFSSRARAAYPMRRDTRACCKLYLEDMICENLGLERPSYNSRRRAS